MRNSNSNILKQSSDNLHDSLNISKIAFNQQHSYNKNPHRQLDAIGMNSFQGLGRNINSLNIENNYKNVLNNSSKYFITNDEDFEIITPKLIKNKEYLNELKENGIELEKCLIVKNKYAFLNYIIKLKETLDNIIYDIDPKEANKKKKRRANQLGIMIGMREFKKEDFLNSTPPLIQEKGMIHFGNKNIELVLSMMIGIRNSINSIGENPSLYPFSKKDEAFRDFNVFNFLQTNFEKEMVVYIIFRIIKNMFFFNPQFFN